MTVTMSGAGVNATPAGSRICGRGLSVRTRRRSTRSFPVRSSRRRFISPAFSALSFWYWL